MADGRVAPVVDDGALAEAVARERDAIEALRALGATSPETARPLSRLGDAHAEALFRLEGDGMVLVADGHRYYLDERALRGRRRTRTRRVLLTAAGAGAVAVGLALVALALMRGH